MAGPLLSSDVASLHSSESIPLAVARYHGDQAAEPGMLDFAVNVRHARPPAWLTERLAARLTDLARYPSRNDERAAIRAVAARHGRGPDEVALLAGAAEGFALLPNLRPRLAAVIVPSFTEPDIALTTAGVPVRHVVLVRRSAWPVCGYPTPPTSWWSATPPTRRRCCTPMSRSWRYAGRAASSSSTRPSPIRFQANRNHWQASRCPTCWCCVA